MPTRRREARRGGCARSLIRSTSPGGLKTLTADGRLRDYAHAAAWLGVSKNRANVISRMIHLAPDLQEAILLGDTGASEHRLREVAREPVWEGQRRK